MIVAVGGQWGEEASPPNLAVHAALMSLGGALLFSTALALLFLRWSQRQAGLVPSGIGRGSAAALICSALIDPLHMLVVSMGLSAIFMLQGVSLLVAAGIMGATGLKSADPSPQDRRWEKIVSATVGIGSLAGLTLLALLASFPGLREALVPLVPLAPDGSDFSAQLILVVGGLLLLLPGLPLLIRPTGSDPSLKMAVGLYWVILASSALWLPAAGMWPGAWWMWHGLRLSSCGFLLLLVSLRWQRLVGWAIGSRRLQETAQATAGMWVWRFADDRFEISRPLLADSIPPEEGEETLAGFRACLDEAGQAAVEEILAGSVPKKDLVHDLHSPSGEPRVVHHILQTLPVDADSGTAKGSAQGVLLDITERAQQQRLMEAANTDLRKELSQAVEEQQQARFQLTAILDGVPDAILVLDRDDTILQCNRASGQLIGGDPEGLIGRNLSAFLSDNPTASTFFVDEETDEIEAWQIFRGRRTDGSGFDAEVWRSGVPSLPGHPSDRLPKIAMIRDVSQRLRHERSLQQSEIGYRGTFQNVKAGLALLDVDGRVLQVNRDFADLMGQTPETLTGQLLSAYLAADDGPSVHQALQTLWRLPDRDRPEPPVSLEFALPPATSSSSSSSSALAPAPAPDEFRQRLFSLSMVSDDGGEALFAVGHLQDISQQCRAQAEAKAAKHVLKEQAGRKDRRLRQLQSVFDALPVPVFLLGLETADIRLANPTALRVFHIQADAVPGFKSAQLWVDPGDRTAAMAALAATGRIEGRDVEVRSAFGQSFWAYLTMCRIEVDEAPMALGVFQEITGRKHLEHELRDARDRAEQNSQRMTTFLTHLSHDLRIPLNAVLGFAQLLDSDPDLSRDQTDTVREITEAAQTLSALVDEILDPSQFWERPEKTDPAPHRPPDMKRPRSAENLKE